MYKLQKFRGSQNFVFVFVKRSKSTLSDKDGWLNIRKTNAGPSLGVNLKKRDMFNTTPAVQAKREYMTDYIQRPYFSVLLATRSMRKWAWPLSLSIALPTLRSLFPRQTEDMRMSWWSGCLTGGSRDKQSMQS